MANFRHSVHYTHLGNVHVLTEGVLPVLAQQWIPAVWGVQCGPAGGGGAGGTHSQETQHHQPQGTVREEFSLKAQCKDYMYLIIMIFCSHLSRGFENNCDTLSVRISKNYFTLDVTLRGRKVDCDIITTCILLNCT